MNMGFTETACKTMKMIELFSFERLETCLLPWNSPSQTSWPLTKFLSLEEGRVDLQIGMDKTQWLGK
jgi:hypothetical protein